MIEEDLRRLLDLQPYYSFSNTPEMAERGELLRGPIRNWVKDQQTALSTALGPFGSSFAVNARDGTGNKIETPWVRFASGQMSTGATDGFYCVIHFSTDGSALHITLGSGSSRLVNGSYRTLPDAEIARQVGWARNVLLEQFPSLSPFGDTVDFKATRKLPKSFERATICAATIRYDEINEGLLRDLLEEAASRLRVIYTAQSIMRHLPNSEQDEILLANAVKPSRSSGRSQSFGLTGAQRKLVELRAMEVASDWLLENGYKVQDVSATASFDIQADKNGSSLKVEVKGTTSQLVDAVLMTSNEINLHRVEKGNTALIIVSAISLQIDDEKQEAVGGLLEAHIGWDIDTWNSTPIAYRVSRS